MLLRSNRLVFPSFYPLHPDITMSCTADTSTTSTTTNTTIKLLHQAPSFKPFSGDDPSYSALSFLESCEDSMCNSNITLDADKIAFIRSNLKPDSLASDMMRASCFNPKLINHDYAVFRKKIP